MLNAETLGPRTDEPHPRGLGSRQLHHLSRLLAPLGPPIIVFNKSHSGSRLLARMLSEAGVFMGADLNESLDAMPVLELVEHAVEFYTPDLGRFLRDGDAALEPLVRSIFTRHLRGFQLPGRWGWKLSETHFALPVVSRLFPDARYVHLVRDGRDVAFCNFNPPTTGFLKKTYFGTDFVRHWLHRPLTPDEYKARPHVFNAQLWVASVRDARAHGEMLGDRYREVRYEALVTDLPSTVRSIFHHLDISAPDSLIAKWQGEVHDRSVGKFRRVPSARLAEALAILEPTLAAFGYGDEVAADETTLTVVVIGNAVEAEPTVRDLGALAMLRPHVVVAEGAAEGLAAATGAYVVFAPAGVRFAASGLPLLLRDASRANANAASGRLRMDPTGDWTPLPLYQDGLAHCDALPPGTVMFKHDAAKRWLPVANAESSQAWHARLIWHVCQEDLLLLTDRRLGTTARDFNARILARPSSPERCIAVYGTAGASASLLFDGLPEALRRRLFFVPPLNREADLERLCAARAVIVLRDYERFLNEDMAQTLRDREIPFFYLADDHYPTLAREMPHVFGFYSSETLTRLLRAAAGAIGASSELTEAFRPFSAEVMTWTPVYDASLVLPLDATADGKSGLRVGVMGSEVRMTSMRDDVVNALLGAAARQPLEVVMREGLFHMPPTLTVSLTVTTVPFEPSFRRFVFQWRRLGVRVILHPTAHTANAIYKNPNALLVALYLGAVPVVSGLDPVYADLPHDCGALVVGQTHATWSDALQEAADPAGRRTRLAALRQYCEETFTAQPAQRALTRLLNCGKPAT